MEKFSQITIEELKYYVYALLDPRDNKIFYIGKGKSNRIFAHLNGALENPDESYKINTIKEIIAEGKKVKHLVLRHGLENEKTAFQIESSIIDLLTFPDFKHHSKITNIVSGQHSWDKGIMNVNEVESLYAAKPLKLKEIFHNLLLININKTYQPGISPYDATRRNWKLSEQRIKKIDFVCGEYKGIIRGIYKPEKWFYLPERKRRYFEGTEVTDEKILKLYLNKAYVGKKKGQANPIRYLKKHQP
jgi:hypothetical protein